MGHTQFHPKPWQKAVALPALFLALLIQGVFSGGMGSLVILALTGLLGMGTLEAQVTKRFSQIILNILIILGLLWTGLIIWYLAALLFATNIFGG